MKSLSHFHPPLEDQNLLKDPRRKDELVKIMIQTLEDLGYRQVAQSLIEESNIRPETDSLSTLREKVLGGHWEEASNVLHELNLNDVSYEKALFLLFEQQYIELIFNKQYNEGLILIRNELSKRCPEPERLHNLASLMMCTTPQEIEEKLGRNLDLYSARKAVLNEIQAECKPNQMLDVNRMNKLLQQAVSFQIINCKYHKHIGDNFSLLEDHQCSLDNFPTKALKTLRDQKDEVWIVKFSHDGEHLASLTGKNELRIWQFSGESPIPLLKLRKDKIHEKEVNCLNWSYDNKKIATCSNDKKVKIWDAENGSPRLTVQGHIDNVCSVVWLPNNQSFISGGLDNHLILWDQRGEQVSKLSSPRILELLIASDGKMLYSICAASPKIIVTDLTKKTEVHQIKEKSLIFTAALSKNNKFLLVNTSLTFPELHLWNLDTYELIQTYTGHFQEKFRIGCCFGGFDEQFIACGGEDSTIKVYHRNSSDPIASLTGHSLTVNSVSWSPKNPNLLVSGSDDQTIKIWVCEDTFERCKENFFTENHSMEIISEENDKVLQEIESGLFEEESSQD